MHHFLDILTEIIAVCSILHTVLPPWDALADFPKAQKYYKLFVYFIGYLALNGRSTVYKNISINNPNGANTQETKNDLP